MFSVILKPCHLSFMENSSSDACLNAAFMVILLFSVSLKLLTFSAHVQLKTYRPRITSHTLAHECKELKSLRKRKDKWLR